MRSIVILLASLAVSGCAQIKFADGERVAIEHENPDTAQLQAQADTACVQSGGRAPAALISNLPVSTVLPAAMSRKTATYRCSR